MARITGGVSAVVAFVNYSSFLARVVVVVTAGTPVQLPNILIPEGAGLFIRSRLENNNNRRIFVAESLVNIAIPASRLTLRPGEGVELNVQNANAVFIDASHNGAEVELLVEQ